MPQPHTGSYYAATANDRTEYPPLCGEARADVCVVGAGFTGVSTALHLAERGYAVRVLEANRIGWGASGRNGGELIGGIAGERRISKVLGPDFDRLVWDMRWAGHEIIKQRVQTYAIQCDLKFGYLDVAIRPKHMRAIHQQLTYLKRFDYPFQTRVLDAEETCALIGTRAYRGALLNMGNGHLHPLNLCLGEAKAAARLGVTFNERSPVVGIDHHRRPVVATEGGSVKADFVVIAGNAYHSLDRRLRGYLFPVNSFIIVTEPLPEEIVRRVNSKDLAVCDPNFVLEYFRLTADKRFLFGGRIRYFGNDPEVIRRRLRAKMLRIYPGLEPYAIDYAWGGTIGVTVNRVPQIGRLSPTVFFSQGYSGHGVNVTHLAGQIVADAIVGTMERFDVFSSIKPVVVPGSHAFSKQMVSLGLMYYQINDRIG
jgi:gamma-glutamylputrescine oxidase